MKNFLQKIILLSFITSGIFSCGKKGALYLPNENQPQEQIKQTQN